MVDYEKILGEVTNDLALRKTLQTARAWHVSPRRFLGLWEAAYVCVYSYDQAGKIVRSEQTIKEPEWNDEDRAYALALEQYEASLCSGCGEPLEETTKPEHDGAYRAELPIRCHRCTAAGVATEAYEENPQPQALMFPVVLDERLIIKPEDQFEFE